MQNTDIHVFQNLYFQCDEINQAACDIAKKVSAKYNTIVAGNTRIDSEKALSYSSSAFLQIGELT